MRTFKAPYFVIVSFNRDTYTMGIQFGDWNREVVKGELQDMKDSGEWKGYKLSIKSLKDDSQATAEDYLQGMNQTMSEVRRVGK